MVYTYNMNNNNAMDDRLLSAIKPHAIYEARTPFHVAPVADLLSGFELQEFASGMQARIFKIAGTNWIVKEGRWDIELPVGQGANIKIHPKISDAFLQLSAYSFLPTEKEILRQYKQYAIFRQYFGYFKTDSDYYHPRRKEIFEKQKRIRGFLADAFDDIQETYKIHIPVSVYDTLNSDVSRVKKNTLDQSKQLKDPVLETNFLPNELLLYGSGISRQNAGKNTFYIFQEYVDGTLLHDMKLDALSEISKQRLDLLAYIILYMHMETGYVPDLRARYLSSPKDWFSGTDNIVINESELKFIDTRWLWNSDDAIIQKAFVLPDLNINAVKEYLKFK